MKLFEDSHALLLRGDRGDKFPELLNDLASAHKWPSAELTGIGGVRNVTLAYFDLEQKQYLQFDVPGVLELLSLKGNLAYVDGNPFWHLHALVGDREGAVRGGHLVSLEVAITLECWIRPGNIRLERSPDSFCGLNLLK